LVASRGPIEAWKSARPGGPIAVPAGHSTWWVVLERADLPRVSGNAVHLDAITWYTPSLSAVAGPFSDGDESWTYDFAALRYDGMRVSFSRA
jgi:hypothetical protein